MLGRILFMLDVGSARGGQVLARLRRVRCSSLFDGPFLCVIKPSGRLFLFKDADIAGIFEIDRLYFAKTNTLGITVTEVAFNNLMIHGIKTHGTEGTDRYTGAASDAGFIINFHPSHFFVAAQCAYRATNHAGGILALLAGHGYI